MMDEGEVRPSEGSVRWFGACSQFGFKHPVVTSLIRILELGSFDFHGDLN